MIFMYTIKRNSFVLITNYCEDVDSWEPGETKLGQTLVQQDCNILFLLSLISIMKNTKYCVRYI